MFGTTEVRVAFRVWYTLSAIPSVGKCEEFYQGVFGDPTIQSRGKFVEMLRWKIADKNRVAATYGGSTVVNFRVQRVDVPSDWQAAKAAGLDFINTTLSL